MLRSTASNPYAPPWLVLAVVEARPTLMLSVLEARPMLMLSVLEARPACRGTVDELVDDCGAYEHGERKAR